eukprot:107683-Rhodomonas_salina.2
MSMLDTHTVVCSVPLLMLLFADSLALALAHSAAVAAAGLSRVGVERTDGTVDAGQRHAVRLARSARQEQFRRQGLE